MIDKGGKRIALVIDENQRLLGTITDGDIRRAILAYIDLEAPLSVLLESRKGKASYQPVTAPAGSDHKTLLKLFRQKEVAHLPLVDKEQRVVDLVTLDQIVTEVSAPVEAVIMAGGTGSRLRPLTAETPKPMLPVGDRPLLELIIDQLRDSGIKHVNVTVHHKQDKITQHFGDGSGFGIDISYVEEDRPLGTAGALGLIETPQVTMLVINGDILTQVDIQAMRNYHREHRADLTLAVRQHDVQVPYGVVECEDDWVRRLVEKPVVKSLINAGIYLLEPSVHSLIPAGEPCDMTEIIERLLQDGRPVAAFPVHEGWIDIGQQADYEEAQKYAEDHKSHP